MYILIDLIRFGYQRRRDIVYDGVKNSRYLEPLYSEGAFYLWAKISDFGTKHRIRGISKSST